MSLKTHKVKFDKIVVHYDEIGLKGKNRRTFEQLLGKNIKKKLKNEIESVEWERGFIFLNPKENVNDQRIAETLKCIPGISHFTFSKRCDLDLDDIKQQSTKLLEGADFETFKLNSKRSNKKFSYSSQDLNNIIGETIRTTFNKKVRLDNPNLTLKLEITNQAGFLSTEDMRGIGGLPTDPSQKVIALLSGGFDSPVAAYLMMKRGCEVQLVHFINVNQDSSAVRNKILKIAEALSRFQNKTRLYLVPFDALQKQLIMKVHSTERMLIFRRLMLRAASLMTTQCKARFLVIGDSLSQVASQTIENLEATYSKIKTNILSPLIGFNKNEIMNIAHNIGTFEISKLPHEDCCSFFVPKHPSLRANIKDLVSAESKIDTDKLLKEAIENREEFQF